MTTLSKTKTEIKDNFPELHQSYYDYQQRLERLVYSLSFNKIAIFYLTLIIVVVLYTYADIEIFNILEIDFQDNIKILTPSVITMVSMNLFVTNLLLTHLKEEREELEKIINKKVRFKFITYYGFTIVMSLLVLYFTSKSYPEYRANILIFIFYSFLLYILLLINLYKIVFDFIGKSSRKQIIITELSLEFNSMLYEKKVKKEFNAKIKLFFETYSFEQISAAFYHRNVDVQNNQNHTTRFNRPMYFRDIKHEKLGKILEPYVDGPKFFGVFNLDEKLPIENDLLLISVPREIKNISRQIIFKERPLFPENTDFTVLNIVLNKIDSNVKQNRRSQLAEDLQSIDSILERFLKIY